MANRHDIKNSKIFGVLLPIIFPIEPPGMVFTIIYKKKKKFYKFFVTFLRTLNLKTLTQLKFFFQFTKIQYFDYVLAWPNS